MSTREAASHTLPSADEPLPKSRTLATAVELDLAELGERARIIPQQDPHLEVVVETIPRSESGGRIIPVCEPQMDGNEEKYVTQAVRSNWISSAGRFITEFENLFAEKVGARYGVACSSGTTALHLGLATLGIGPGDEVIVPTFTMIASPNSVAYTGAKIVLVDSEAETYNMDISQVESKITPRTKAIMPVHTYGHPVDMDGLLDIARRHNLFVIGDTAEAHGAEYKGHPIGGLGDLATYSFYANKIISTGEGGMITTNNAEIAGLARNLRDHAFSRERHFWHKYLGYNFRMTNLQGAVGLAQTERFEALVECRRRNALLYNEFLADVPGLTLPPEREWAKSVFWMYSVLVGPAFGKNRDQLRQALAKRGIETRTFFIPIHLQPIYYAEFGRQEFPIAEMLCERGVYLPSAPTLTRREIEFITVSIKACQQA